MGLNDTYDMVRNQIIVVDPLPFVNKACSMILRVDKQKNIQTNVSESLDNSVMLARTNLGGYGRGQENRKRDSSKKEDRVCNYYKGIRHIKENCFKLHGYPNWFKQLKKEKGNNPKAQVNLANNPLEEGHMIEKEGSNTCLSPELLDLVQQEVNKLLRKEQSGVEQVNFAHVQDFSGNTHTDSHINSNFVNKSWIIDTGATSHICNCKTDFKCLKLLDKKIDIYMPDGSIRYVNEYGDVFLSKTVILKNVLYVPTFKYNLISVVKILRDTMLRCIFFILIIVFFRT